MKKLTLTLSLLLFVGVSIADTQQVSFEEIPLQIGITDSTHEHEPVMLSLAQIPSIALNGHTLKFATSCDDCILSIVDEVGNIEFETFILKGTKSITLPSCLSGHYYIQITSGAYFFWGNINL